MTRPSGAIRATVALWALMPLAALASVEDGSSQPGGSADVDQAPIATRQILVTFADRPTRRLPGAGSTRRGYSGRRNYETSPRSARLAAKLAREYDLEHVDGWPIELLGVHCVVYEVPAGRTTTEVIQRLVADPRVDSAQQMQLFEVLGRASYDDPHFDLQHGLHSMQVEQAHQWSRGAGVRVAVVDTGVDVDHPELAGRVAIAENFVDDDALGFARDRHGTAVAGIIASRAGNGLGIVGVAPLADVLALKACWEGDAGSSPAVCSTFTLAKAISFAVRKRADVLNLSLTGPADALLSALLSEAIDQGVIVVSALAGDRRDLFGFPASLDRVIAVAASEAPKSTLPLGLRAPGDDVLTIRPGAAYDFMSGSSLAAAHVSGVTALLLERSPRLTHESIHRLLEATSHSTETAVAVNACAALAGLLGTAGCAAAAEQDRAEAEIRPGSSL